MDLKLYFAIDPKRRATLANVLGCNPEYLYQVATKRRQASPKLAQRIEQATSGEVTRATLRPDIWAQAA